MFIPQEIKSADKVPAPGILNPSFALPDIDLLAETEDWKEAQSGKENEEGETRQGAAGIRRCRKCNAILRSGNKDDICCPCGDAKKWKIGTRFVSQVSQEKF